MDEEVVESNGIVTSRKPDDIPAFNREMIALFSKGAGKAASGASSPNAKSPSLCNAVPWISSRLGQQAGPLFFEHGLQYVWVLRRDCGRIILQYQGYLSRLQEGDAHSKGSSVSSPTPSSIITFRNLCI